MKPSRLSIGNVRKGIKDGALPCGLTQLEKKLWISEKLRIEVI
jgi:hypothetical protein